METKYIKMKINNSIWVLNRVTNLIRKRNYNIDDMNMAFDNEGHANLLIWFCTKKIDINQVSAQLSSLYDVISIEIIEDLNRIRRTYFVYSDTEEKLKGFSFKPDKIVKIPSWKMAIFILNCEDWYNFEEDLKSSWLRYLSKSI